MTSEASISQRPNEEAAMLRVLVVDDNRDSADTTAMLLRMWGYQADVAYDATGALRAIDGNVPRVVLLDLSLPGTDGYAVAEMLRQRPGLADVTVVALTGHADEDLRRRSLEAGFHSHLVKPVDPVELQRLLARLDGSARPPGVA